MTCGLADDNICLFQFPSIRFDFPILIIRAILGGKSIAS